MKPRRDMGIKPYVSVVVLNYNGIRFLDSCLGSLSEQDYPKDRYEVVLVDNLSTDGSVETAAKRFPRVRVVRNGRNLGFAAGNNVAMRHPEADYVALVNNDTIADRRWITELVEAAERDSTIGACTSKLLFTHGRVKLRMETEGFSPAETGSRDTRLLGVQFFAGRVLQGDEARDVEYLDGFFGYEPSPDGAFRWSTGEALLGLRVDKSRGPALIQLSVAAPRADERPASISFWIGETLLGRWDVDSRPRQIEVILPEYVVSSAAEVIQNAGTLILNDGSGRDRGTLVRGTEAYSEDDLGQYDQPEEVFAGCGAALLLRRDMLEDVGLFDEDFFMYYEDVDLSWRARRRGWRILYVPRAVVHHVHCGSSVEWSPLFLFHVERNRLLILAKNAPLSLALREHVRYAGEAALNLGRYLRAVIRRSPGRQLVGRRTGIQLRVLASLAGLAPRTISKRRELKKSERIPMSKLLEWTVTG